MKHLCWTLLGITDLELFSASESPSDILAKLLYAIFIVGALVLLVNMMIAVLSHTYERVEKNSLIAWSFKRAVTIRTYRDYHPIPVPLNLLSQFFLALYRKSKRKNTPDHETMDKKVEALDHMIDKLKVIYFAKYGFSFPLSDENKINNMLAETERNREMCNQIVRRVFIDPNQTNFCPVGPSAWKSKGIAIEDNMLTYVGPEGCDHCRISRNEFHGAKYKLPFSSELPKFEVIIQEGGMKRDLIVGVVREKHDVHNAAGDINNTVGYHACNGRIVYPDASKTQNVIEGPVAYRGDLIGCRAGFDEVKDAKIPIYFTLNGQAAAKVSIKLGSYKSDLFPFVGMKHKGIRVLAKMCPGEEMDPNKRQSLESNHECLASMFSETEQTKILYHTFESVEEVKESSDILLQYMHENSQKIADDIKAHEENITKIESTVNVQNRKIEDLQNTLHEILKILKEGKEGS